MKRLRAVGPGLRARLLLLLALSPQLSACSHPAPAPAPILAADTTPAPSTASVVTARSVVGSYRLNANIQSNGPRGPRRPNNALITLTNQAAAVPMMGAPPSAQFNATVALPGYSRAPRGRQGQAGAWWPIPGDSIVVQFQGPGSALIQLRGAVQGTRIDGEVWYLSVETGATFQLGTFSGTRK